jgi:hypothetical protein
VNQTVDILCRARELYASAPSHAEWGADIEPDTHCVITATVKASGGLPVAYTPALVALAAASEMAASTDFIAAWNADHSTAEVLAAFDRAITAQRLIVPPLQHAERRIPVHAGQES